MSNDQKRDGGGSAFPVLCDLTPVWNDQDARLNREHPDCYAANTEDGMTLRDYFAAAALTALAQPSTRPCDIPACAEYAYQIADAMLEARKR